MSTRAEAPSPILAIDPGKDKCGIAIVAWENAAMRVQARQIVPAPEVERALPPLIEQWRVKQIVLGDATTSRGWHERLAARLPGIVIALVREANSTFEARALYWRAHPPRGWRRVLPLSLQVPPEPLDDFAAVVLARRFFEGR